MSIHNKLKGIYLLNIDIIPEHDYFRWENQNKPIFKSLLVTPNGYLLIKKYTDLFFFLLLWKPRKAKRHPQGSVLRWCQCKLQDWGQRDRHTHHGSYPPTWQRAYRKLLSAPSHALRLPDSCAFLRPWLHPRPEATRTWDLVSCKSIIIKCIHLNVRFSFAWVDSSTCTIELILYPSKFACRKAMK